ncbi:hypothetical protein ILUMI_04610 [Ignelater luminosus]|uniref:CSC1-like protein 2 n=1 Tax=Ignelater luminosus TaxID=2038154 RepID=A0A8K0DDZ9_IGNLU|nr:hypothetical protein ILUMI_04610 [Ignelater luminosus]
MVWPKFNFSENILMDNESCFSANRHPNSTALFINVYEGIPETLLLNLIAWILLLLLFALLRNRAWDYGRLALVQNEKWTQLFYKNTEEAVAVEETTADTSLSADSGCCSWFPAVFTINKQRLFARCGPDASHYLSFQRHLLVLTAIITIVSVCIILPINFQGNLQGTSYTFGHTTISNLEPTSKWLWAHIIASFCFVPLTILIMRRCSSRIPTATLVSSRTIMVTHISRNHRNLDEIRNYFLVRYPNMQIKDITIAYKIKELTKLEQQRECAHEAKCFCIMNNEHGMKVQPHGCIICCPWKSKNALEYYTAEEERLYNLVIEKRREAVQQPLGIAFITFSTEEAAQYVVQSFVPGTRFHWTITKAPAPPDILWENLQISSRNWYSKAILINFFLFIILFFLTTPAIVVNLLNTLTSSQENIFKKVSPFLSEFLPTLLLLTMSAIMPVIVAYSDQLMSHWTKSEQNFATMQKTFYFLLFMVLILPSLGLTSAQALVSWSVQSNNTYRWECIFLPDKGAIFVNYVITSALIGTALELLRFPELAMYVWRLLIAKSSAEKISIQKAILSEFPFGIHYAWTLLIFTTSTVYSLICPLITPFGLLYLCLKHMVDKHNIYFVYRPSGMCGEGQKIHVSAVRNVRVGIILLQIIMLAFAVVRGGLSSMSIITLLGLIASCSFFFLMGPFPSCKPTALSVNNFSEHERYVAPVLIKVHSQNHTPVTATPDYGSSSVNDLSKQLCITPSIAT